jgi:hypothetical protein
MEDNKELIGIIVSCLAGTFAILASIFNWNFFFENRKARFFVNVLGRQGSRIFYVALGTMLLFLAYKIYSDSQQLVLL